MEFPRKTNLLDEEIYGPQNKTAAHSVDLTYLTQCIV